MTNETKFSKIKNSIKTGFDILKDKAIDYGIATIKWVKDNPEIITAVLVPTAIAGIRSGQSLIVSHRVNKQNERADRTWYDRSTGLRWELKRKMSNNDRMAITKLKAEGMSTIDILMKLNLI